jgi:hypothetical protein
LVEIPNGRYSGQKLINPVSTKMPETNSNPIAMGPVMTLKIYKDVMIPAITILIALSAIPIFDFIIFVFLGEELIII